VIREFVRSFQFHTVHTMCNLMRKKTILVWRIKRDANAVSTVNFFEKTGVQCNTRSLEPTEGTWSHKSVHAQAKTREAAGPFYAFQIHVVDDV
jgi:hypothetical protein